MERIVFGKREVVITDLESAYDYLDMMVLKYESYLKFLEHRGTIYYARQIFYETNYDLDNLWKDMSIEIEYEMDLEKIEWLKDYILKDQLKDFIIAIKKKRDEIEEELQKIELQKYYNNNEEC